MLAVRVLSKAVDTVKEHMGKIFRFLFLAEQGWLLSCFPKDAWSFMTSGTEDGLNCM